MRRKTQMSATLLLTGALLMAAGLWAMELFAVQTSGDGRINLIAPLGGATIYCVDAQRNPASTWEGGGIRVLDMNGIEVLFAPAASIAAPGAGPIVLAEGQGRYSLLTLYLLPSGEFQLNGVDDKGQPFEFRWTDCVQQGAALSSDVLAPTIPPPPIVPVDPLTREISALCAACQEDGRAGGWQACVTCVRANQIDGRCFCPPDPP